GVVTINGRRLVKRDKGATWPLRVEGPKPNRLARALVTYADGRSAELTPRDVGELNAVLALTLMGTKTALRFGPTKPVESKKREPIDALGGVRVARREEGGAR